MKKISIVVPCYNEEENVKPISEAIINQLKKLSKYDYEIIFIDNCSTDKTREYLVSMCEQNNKIKAIFNSKNFGQFNSPYYGMLQSTGDCTILICADFQDPIEMIPKFVKEWENGYKIVIVIKKLSDVEQIEHFTGFGLYDKKFIEVLRKLDDPTPFLRGIIAELGFQHKEIYYTQEKRKAGKTHNNFYKLYDAAMLSFTSYTKIGLRLATFLGGIVSCISFFIGVVYLILKLMYWDRFVAGMAPILIGIFFLGALQIFFIGILGEYILAINTRVMKRPLVIEEKRINF